MTFLSSRPRVPPSVLLVEGVPAVSGVLGAGIASWLVAEASGGLWWWAFPVATGGLWWCAGRQASMLTVEVARDLRAWRRKARSRA